MFTDIKSIKEFVEWAEHIPYVKVWEGCFWQVMGDEFCYDPTPNLLPDEWEYSLELNGEPLRKDGLVVVNCDNDCGQTITMVFQEDNEIK